MKSEKKMDNKVGVMQGHELRNMRKLYKLEKARREVLPLSL